VGAGSQGACRGVEFDLRIGVKRREYLQMFVLVVVTEVCETPHLAEGDEIFVGDLQCRKRTGQQGYRPSRESGKDQRMMVEAPT